MESDTTHYVGNHYEVKGTSVTKYYFAGATRLAVRKDGLLRFLLGDHLGSSSVTTNINGVKTASALYKAFGESRYSFGDLNTDYHFTGQREEASLGIYYFGARWMDPSLGRFTSPDSIIPTSTQGTQAWDRYAFVNNNPVRYNDPTGHYIAGNCNYRNPNCDFQQTDEPEYHSQSWWDWFFSGQDTSQSCIASLLECYYSHENMQFENNQRITMEEFTKLLIAVYFDLKSMDDGALPLGNSPFDKAIRIKFDTPFYNGTYWYRDEMTQERRLLPKANQVVCIESVKCSPRSFINYFAQGMWSAAAGQKDAYAAGQEWKESSHQAPLTADEMFWMEYGYNMYNTFESMGLYDALTTP